MNKKKTKSELLLDLEQAHKRIAELESVVSKHEQAGYFHQVLMKIKDVVWTSSLDGLKILDANLAFEEFYGHRVDEFKANPNLWWEVVHPDDQAMARTSMETLSKTGYAEAEYRILHPDGSVRWILDRKTFLYDEQGSPAQLGGIASDITERKQIEEKLRESEARYRLIAENAADVIWVLDPALGKFTYVSPSVEKLRGYTPEEVMAQKVEEALTPESQKLVTESLAKNLPPFIARGSGTQAFINNVDQPCKDGSIVSTEVTTTYLFNERGKVEVVGVTRNITERKRAEKKLRESEEQYRFLVNNTSDFIARYDRHGIVVFATDTSQRFNGYKPEEILHTSGLERIHPEDRDNVAAVLRRTVESGTEGQVEYRVKRKGGDYMWVEAIGRRVISKAGEPEVIVAQRDITERKQAELEVENVAKFPEENIASVLRFGSDGRLLYANPASGTLLDLWGCRLGDLPPLEIQQLISEVLLTALGREVEVAHGEIIDSLKFVPIAGKDYVNVYGRDITARKQAEQRLQHNEEFLRQIIDLVPHFIFSKDLESRFLLANRAVAEAYGTTTMEIFGKSDLDFSVTPEEALHFHQDDLAVIESGKPKFIPEEMITDSAGNTRYLQTTKIPFLFGPEQAPSLLGVSIDITERKQSEHALIESERKMNALVTSLDDIVFEFDEDGTYLNVWAADESKLVRPKDQLFGQRMDDVLGEKIGRPLCEAVKRAVLEGRFETIEYPLQVMGGQLWFMARVSPVITQDGSHRTASMLVRDITERKQAEEKLRESEEKYRGLMDTLDSSVAAIDADGKFLYLNEVAAKWLGGTPLELVGRTIFELFPEPVASQQMEGVRQVIRGDRGRVSETVSFVKGQPRWFHNSIQPIHNEHGQVAYVILHATDIHEIKTIQQQLEELNRSLEARVEEATAEIQDLYNNAPSGYHSLDANGNFILINQTELNWLGYTLDEIIGRPFTDFITPDSLGTFRANFPAFKQRGWVRDLEFDLVRRDGTILPVLVNATAIKDQAGVYVMSRSTVIDITERKQAEATLRESEDRYRRLIELSPMSIIGFGEDARFELLNQKAIETLGGTSAEDFIGKPIFDFVHPDYRGLARERLYLANKTNNAVPIIETVYLKLNGESIPVIASGVVMKFQGRSMSIVSFFDNTEYKQAEQELRENRDQLSVLNKALEKASRAKDEFLANMSHELRTPLNGILGMAEILLEGQRGELNERQRTYVTTIDNSGRHLLSLINDILDLSKIEAEKLELQIEKVSVRGVCQASLSFVKEPASKKGITLDLAIEEGVEFLHADERRLKQILVNLLSNAVKFTPEKGRIGLEVRLSHGRRLLDFSVSDTGIGIPAEDQERLFSPFTQVDNSFTRNHEGTGLGLALVKRLTEMHGGAVLLDSEVGRGSRFTVCLPWQESDNTLHLPTDFAVSADDVSRLTADRKNDATILLVEDNQANLLMIGDYLNAKGYRMVYASNGYEALEGADEASPDLILMDIQMPRMDGLEATQRLRADPRFADTPIVVLTAYAMAGDRERCLEAGATAYLSKPVKLRELAVIVEKLLG